MFVGTRLHSVLLVYRLVREVEKPDEQCYPRYFLKQMPVRRIVAIWLKHAESPLFILIANGYLLDLTCRFRRLELLNQFIVECLKGIIVLYARSCLA